MNTYELEIWFFHEDEKTDITETIQAESIEQAIEKVRIKHPHRIYNLTKTETGYNKERVY